MFGNPLGSRAGRDKKRESDPARKRVSRYSRGNVNLQRGHYVTKEEKDARKKAIFSYSFSNREERTS